MTIFRAVCRHQIAPLPACKVCMQTMHTLQALKFIRPMLGPRGHSLPYCLLMPQTDGKAPL